MSKVECEILGLSTQQAGTSAYALLLKEVDGERRLPIIIGQSEAHAIAVVLEGFKPPRPLTHDLLKNTIENLGATILEIVISELRDNTFYSKIILDVSSMTNEIDARPSDAIALAIRAQVPIYVEESVMEVASIAPSLDSSIFDEEKTGEQHASSSKEAKIAALQNQLRLSLENEDYERAAKIRDEINRLTKES